MPSFKSNGGVWTPANEFAVNIRTGETYKGPDREAAHMIKEAGGQIGMLATDDPENIMKARQLNMTVEEYLALGAPPKAIQEKAQKAKDEAIVDHKDTPKKKMVNPVGGGVNIKGGFGEQPQI